MSIQILSWNCMNLDNIVIPDQFSRSLRRADDYIRFGVAAGYAALEKADALSEVSSSTGLVVSSGFGPLDTNFDILEQLVQGEPTSPTLFSHSVFNAAAGYMATTLGLQGAALTVTELEFPFFRALEQVRILLLSKVVESCLVLHIETYDELFHDAAKKETCEPWQPGVVCWYLSGSGSEGVQLTGLEVEYGLAKKDDYLAAEEEFFVNDNLREKTRAMAGGQLITGLLDEMKTGESAEVRVKNPYGQVEINLQK